MHLIGIDIGGTKIEGILLSTEFKVLDKKRVPTIKENYTEFLNQIHSLVDGFHLEDEFNVGIGIPGTISDTGVVNHSNIQNLIGRNLKKDLTKLLDKKIIIENDSNCFALAEALLGSGKSYGVVLGVIIGTGVGAGIIINGKIFHGRNNFAGEWGHHSIYQTGKNCYCGRRGCVDQYISGPALGKRWSKLTGKNQSIQEILNNRGHQFFDVWKSEFLTHFGFGIANLISILDPDIIILGGGLSNIEFLYDEGIKTVATNLPRHLKPVPIVRNSLGDSAGSLGAALLTSL